VAFAKSPKLLEADALREYAHKALSMRALSAGELRDKLRRKAADKADVDPIIERLRELGAVNDARFASAFAERRLENEGFGQQRVLRDLQKRRVAGGVAQKAVSKAFAETDENQLAEDFLKRKYRKVDLPVFLAEQKNLASAFRKLRLAGFSSSASLRVLKRYSQEAEDLSDVEDDHG
jgi:regulatory protein